MGYGTGAIMAVPGHDERDFAFATAFGLPITRVVADGPSDEAGAPLDGSRDRAGRRGELVERRDPPRRQAHRRGQGRDHRLACRSRAWVARRSTTSSATGSSAASATGASRSPSCSTSDDRAHAVACPDLPVRLPDLDDFRPSGKPEPPLGKATEWVRYSDAYVRETNTMPQWAGSCWYYLRYLDPKNDRAFCDPELEKYWMPVDLYVGGAEHAVLHLLYSRFWHKVLFDRGHVSTPEPFQRLVNQGMILGETEYTGYRDASGAWVSAAEVEEGEGHEHVTLKGRPDEPVEAVKLDRRAGRQEGGRLRPRRGPARSGSTPGRTRCRRAAGNVINPDTVVEEYGADSLRLYEMFMGPLEAVKPWSMKGVEGVYRFLGRAWRMIVDADAPRTCGSTPGSGTSHPSAEQARTRRADGRGRDRRPRAPAVQHRDQPPDGVHQRLHRRRGPAAIGDGDLHAPARAAGPPRRRGALAGPRPRPDPRLRALADLRPRAAQGRRKSRSPSRSTASSAAAWSSPPTPTATPSRPPRGATNGSPRCSKGRRSARSWSCRESSSTSSLLTG